MTQSSKTQPFSRVVFPQLLFSPRLRAREHYRRLPGTEIIGFVPGGWAGGFDGHPLAWFLDEAIPLPPGGKWNIERNEAYTIGTWEPLQFTLPPWAAPTASRLAGHLGVGVPVRAAHMLALFDELEGRPHAIEVSNRVLVAANGWHPCLQDTWACYTGRVRERENETLVVQLDRAVACEGVLTREFRLPVLAVTRLDEDASSAAAPAPSGR